MTVRELLAVMRRRWYVTLCAVVGAALLTVLFSTDGGVYHSKTVVWFTMPSTSTLAADNGSKDGDVIAFAGAIATAINRGRPAPRYSSSSAPFYGAGVREGVLVGLRDDGSQWGSSFGTAVIDVEVVGRTEAWVRTNQQDVLAHIETLVDDLIAQAPTAAKDRVTVTVEPLTTGVEAIHPSRLASVAGAVAMAAAGVIIGACGAVLLDRIALRRVRSRRFTVHRARTRDERHSLVGGKAR